MVNRIFIFSIFFLISCTGYQERPHQDDERIHAHVDDGKAILDISFTSPSELGWIKERYNYSIVTLKKNGGAFEENQEIEAYITDLDMPFYPAANFTQRKKQDIQTYYAKIQEFKLQTLDVKAYPENNLCIRIYVLLEDLRSGKEGQPKRLSEQHALSCVFPVHQRMGFEIRYYQRYYEQNKDNQFASKADALFKSLIIEDKLPSWLRRL